MSAIAGVWYLDGKPAAAEGVSRMLSALRMYGPDASAMWSDGNIAMGRQLMRLLPEDAYDSQPLSTADGRLRLVADVRLDNRDELEGLLRIETPSETSDAAILLAAFERWGEHCVDHLAGDFAFVVWNSIDRCWHLVTDPFGARPLFYFRSKDVFAFASMPKGLHALPGVPYAPNEELMAEFLDLFVNDGSVSCFRDIHRVAQGQHLVVSQDRITSRLYWRPALGTLRLRQSADYQDGLRFHLDRAVKTQLRGLGPIGTHLSGGLDSSAVTATAARILAQTQNRLTALTYAPRADFNGPSPPSRFTDESTHAAATAGLYPNIDHVIVRTPDRSPLDALDRAFFLYDQPLLNLCNNVWDEAINDSAAALGVRVMLTGALGNFTISYDGAVLPAELIRQGRLLHFLKEAAALARRRPRALPRFFMRGISPLLPDVLLHRLGKRLSGLDPTSFSLLNPQRRSELGLQKGHARSFASLAKAWNRREIIFDSLRRLQVANYRKGALAHWRIDMRDPTTERRLAEFCFSVPTDQFMRKGLERSLARTAFADRLPRMVLEERRRGLQGADWYIGLSRAQTELKDEIDRLANTPSSSHLLDIERLRALAENWPETGWETPETNMSYRLGLLRAISAGDFLRKASRSNA